MRKGVLGLVGLSAGVALICFCGDSGNNAPVEAATTVPIANLRLDNASVPGWTDSSYVAGDTATVMNTVNGDAVLKIEKGMRYFSRQTMYNGDHYVNLDVFDFATVQNAKGMFSYSKQHGSEVAWGTYDPAKVSFSNTEFWTYVTAQINKYYIHMSFFLVNADSTFIDSCANLFYQKYLTIVK